MRTRHILGTGLAALALLALAACTTTPDGADGGPGDGSTGTGGTTAECLQGSWALDGRRQLTQLQENFTAQGMAAQATLVEGGVTLDVDGDAMTYDSNITYTMTVDISGGLQLQVVQTQFGVSTGTFAEEGGEIVFRDWTNGIRIENTVSVGGEASDMPIEIPADTGTGVAMEVTCSGDRLETTPAGSPFTGYWSRNG